MASRGSVSAMLDTITSYEELRGFVAQIRLGPPEAVKQPTDADWRRIEDMQRKFLKELKR